MCEAARRTTELQATERRRNMKKRFFAILLAFCVAFSMMPATALAAETADNAQTAPFISIYKDAEGTDPVQTEVTGGVYCTVNELDEFYVVSNVVPVEGEVLGFYGNGFPTGLNVSETQYNSKGQAYAKVTVTGKFDNFHWWITLWHEPSEKFAEEELCGVNAYITKSTSTITAKEITESAKESVRYIDLKMSTSKTSKGIKVKAKYNEEATPIENIESLQDQGCKVKYQFYRSTSKSKGYKTIKTTTSKTYTDTKAKKGTKYYYKCKVLVYDANGKLIAKTKLSQCTASAKKR